MRGVPQHLWERQGQCWVFHSPHRQSCSLSKAASKSGAANLPEGRSNPYRFRPIRGLIHAHRMKRRVPETPQPEGWLPHLRPSIVSSCQSTASHLIRRWLLPSCRLFWLLRLILLDLLHVGACRSGNTHHSGNARRLQGAHAARGTRGSGNAQGARRPPPRHPTGHPSCHLRAGAHPMERLHNSMHSRGRLAGGRIAIAARGPCLCRALHHSRGPPSAPALASSRPPAHWRHSSSSCPQPVAWDAASSSCPPHVASSGFLFTSCLASGSFASCFALAFFTSFFTSVSSVAPPPARSAFATYPAFALCTSAFSKRPPKNWPLNLDGLPLFRSATLSPSHRRSREPPSGPLLVHLCECHNPAHVRRLANVRTPPTSDGSSGVYGTGHHVACVWACAHSSSSLARRYR